MSLALGFSSADDGGRHIDPDAAAEADLGHLLLDWATQAGWHIVRWGPHLGSPATALAGHYRTTGPRVSRLRPGLLGFLRAWTSHVYLAIREPRPAVVLAPFPLLGLGVAVLRGLGWGRGRFAVRVVGRTSTVARDVESRPGRAWVMDRVEGFVLRRADLVLTIGPTTTRYAQRQGVGASRLLEVPDPPVFSMPIGDVRRTRRPVRLLWAGRCSPEKGVGDLIRAVAQLPEQDVRLVVAGDGPERARWEADARQQGIGDRVEFPGWLDRRRLDVELVRADIAVLPSRCEEGLSRFLVEAAAAGCALVATGPGGTEDIVGGVTTAQPERTSRALAADAAGLLVPRGDVLALRAALQLLIEDPLLVAGFAATAQRRAAAMYAQRDRGLALFAAYCRHASGPDRLRGSGTLRTGGARSPSTSRRVRCLIVTGEFAPELGGTATLAMQLEAGLTQRSFTVRVLTLSDDERPGIEGSVVRLPRRGALARTLQVATSLRRMRTRYDVLLALSLHEPTALAARVSRRPVIMYLPSDQVWERARRRHLTELDFDAFQRRPPRSLRIRSMQRLRLSTLRAAEVVLVPSEAIAAAARGWGADPHRIRVLPPTGVGTVVDAGAPPSPSGPRRLVFVGRLADVKRVDVLIRAVAQLEATHLEIVGDGPQKENLVRLAAEVEAPCTFTGALPHVSALERIAAADLLVLASEYESLSRVAVEALSLGRPVLAPAVGGLREVCREGVDAVFVDEISVESVLEAVRALQQDRDRWTALCAGAADAVHRWNPSETVAVVAEVLAG